MDDQERLFISAERLAQDFNLFPSADPEAEFSVEGLLSQREISSQLMLFDQLDIDNYIETVVSPAEMPDRVPAPDVIEELGAVTESRSDGAYYHAIVTMAFDQSERRVGFLAQDRSFRNGEWGPEDHLKASEFVRRCARAAIPIVSLMDTPGAAADEEANRGNQAHNISRLIAVMSDVDVPNLGIIFGIGYSGGAIPLAASNMILSVRDGLFNTIQPRGLANIARRLNLSWQECAKHVGVSSYELMDQGNIDGIVDYVPGETGEKFENFRRAIVTGITSVERSARAFVVQETRVRTEYDHVLDRYLNPSERMVQNADAPLFEFQVNPTEYINVFGVAYRLLRYLRVRRRIKSTSKSQYGYLARTDPPGGELKSRTDRERRRVFFRWLQDPDPLIYDNDLRNAWRDFERAKEGLDAAPSFLPFRRSPQQRFELAQNNLLNVVTTFLYNRWKTDAPGNLETFSSYLENVEDAHNLIRPDQLANPVALVRAIAEDENFGPAIRERFTHDGKKLLRSDEAALSELGHEPLANQLAIELNLALSADSLQSVEGEVSTANSATLSSVARNRGLLAGRFPTLIARPETQDEQAELDVSNASVLDVMCRSELRELFIDEMKNLRIFDALYDEVLDSLESVAQEAKETQSLDRFTLTELLNLTMAVAVNRASPSIQSDDARRFIQSFYDWYLRLVGSRRSHKFLTEIEEWKKSTFSHVSDTLFVVVTHLFGNILESYLRADREGARYVGKIKPKNIGRKRDFWNRLNNAYRDLQLQSALEKYKRQGLSTYEAFRDEFFDDFQELFGDQLSSDPCQFPGFRSSLERALAGDTPPCGVVAGIGTFKQIQGGLRVGTVISNPGFQAGAFDMASAEKFCRLLVTCAERRLPLICFISSGGMQTKEGAGSLFSMAAINDRVTHFIRDYDLPVIVFAHGDCTGGAQASFVTHPLVHTYYLSGASMPFAGQIVVPSNLPLDSILANYLMNVDGSMQGLVKHPFHKNLDGDLKSIDPDIPVPTDSIADVVSGVMKGVLSAGRSAQARPVRSAKSYDKLYNPVQKTLVHARGCAAVKIVRTAQKSGIDVVLVQSDPDMDSVPADLIKDDHDELVSIGGSTPDESYLNARSVVAVAEHNNVDSLHPGIGFLSESSQFAELVRSHGINFIGPPVSSMETMGNKSNAINTALALGVSVVPGSHGIVTDADQAANLAEQIGFPILIKAVHGGGGKGIQEVDSVTQFHEAFQRVSNEARAAFGSSDVYLEKFVTNLRHIEVQILRDREGHTKVLGIRDCSVQRDKQKLLEESGSTALSPDHHVHVMVNSEAIANKVDYVGAGTCEFIYDQDADECYFMEMNTRLQVEHPVTELVSGVDIVYEQFRIAGGASIADLEVGEEGYAIEARINAERVVRGADGTLTLVPSAGEITHCEMPDDPDVDVISIAETGKFISPYYDSMIGQIIAHGKDREDTASKLAEFLSNARIEGIATNIPLLTRVLQDQVFLDGDYNTDYLLQFFTRVDADQLISEIDAMLGTENTHVAVEDIRIEDTEELKVLAPSTGIFYLKPTPAERDYVKHSDRISVDTTLCQIEAFKVFTPLKLRDLNTNNEVLYSPHQEYEVARINVSSGQQVNAGDLLFVVRPQDEPGMVANP